MSGTEPGAVRRGRRGPARRPLPPGMEEELVRVARARHEAEEAYIAAIVEAHRQGATNVAIAEAVGVTDESVRKTVRRHVDRVDQAD